jgi:hypothetical protein
MLCLWANRTGNGGNGGGLELHLRHTFKPSTMKGRSTSHHITIIFQQTEPWKAQEFICKARNL